MCLFIAFCFFWAIRSRTSLDVLCLTIANQVKEDTDQDAPEGGINRAPRLRIPDPWGTSDQHLQRPLPEPYCFVFEYSDPLAVLLCWAKASVYRRGGTWGGRSGHTPETDAPCRTRKFLLSRGWEGESFASSDEPPRNYKYLGQLRKLQNKSSVSAIADTIIMCH